MKRILIIGNGGREHTLVWAVKRSKNVEKVFCASGNAGTAADGENVNIPITPPFREIIEWARKERIDLTVVGPENPLVDGIADAFESEGLKVFGPRAACARLEGSKSFAKEVMEAAGVPTANARSFNKANEALAALKDMKPPIVIKADGLAAGKGVTIAQTHAEAEKAIREAMEERVFGESGASVLIEDFLEGEEASILALVDGERFVCLPTSQDHKRIGEGDTGPNTGGMGAYSPAPVVTPELLERIERETIAPIVREMKKRGTPYRGVLYAGLMIGPNGPKVVEYNCRFGDPETQAVLPRLRTDLVELLEACAEGRLPDAPLEIDPRPAVCVVAASKGYPGAYEKGKEIRGLEEANRVPDTVVFHAGTSLKNGRVLTSGGRVLGVTSLGNTLEQALERSYRALRIVEFEGITFRNDIAHRALARKS